jgi:Domain of unknown function (DUF5655)/Domain of unknown function (DUF4287)
MSDLEKALATQVSNIEKRAGKPIAALLEAVRKSGIEKHGEMRSMVMESFKLGYGDANMIVTLARKALSQGEANRDPLDEIYTGNKAGLRPIHERLLRAIEKFGEFEIAPKKGYVSLRRSKQFAMIGPKSQERIEVGINLKSDAGAKRFVAQKPGGMCQYVVSLTALKDVDGELLAVLKKAYDSAA